MHPSALCWLATRDVTVPLAPERDGDRRFVSGAGGAGRAAAFSFLGLENLWTGLVGGINATGTYTASQCSFPCRARAQLRCVTRAAASTSVVRAVQRNVSENQPSAVATDRRALLPEQDHN